MSESDQEIQQNELLALQSIYGDSQMVLSPENNGGKLAVYVELPEGFKIAYPAVKVDAKGEQAVAASEEEPPYAEINIQYLPPVILNFELPPNYPSQVPPTYTLTCKWLTVLQLSELCNHLDNIWSEQGCGSEVLFEWMQFLTDNIMSCLNVTSPLVLSRLSSKYLRLASTEQQNIVYDKRTIQDTSSVDKLVIFLTGYNSQEAIRHFNTTYFNCGVCFIEKLGIDCVTFQQCKHVYCTDCVTNYFIVQITEGSVRSLNCPEGKCDSQADPNMVKKLVSAELYEKYDKLLLQTTLDCMDDMTYCPRTSCMAAVLHESDLKNMGRCPVCNFVFCVLCQRTYHGVTGCVIKSKELLSLREEYINGTEEERLRLEKRYGKVRLLEAVEEHFSQAWLEKFCKQCPFCRYGIQKVDGCNKMVCVQCKTNFCWICKKILAKNDPYFHFNDFKSNCSGKLFDGVDDGEDSDDEFDFL